MYQALMGVDPPFHAKARNEASIERVPTVTDTLRYYVYDGANYGKGVDEIVDRWIWDWAGSGTGIKKWRWDRKFERYVDVVTSIEPGAPQIQLVNGKEVAVPSTKQVEKEQEVVKKIFDGPVCELIDWEDFVTIGGGGDPDLAEAAMLRYFLTASVMWQ